MKYLSLIVLIMAALAAPMYAQPPGQQQDTVQDTLQDNQPLPDTTQEAPQDTAQAPQNGEQENGQEETDGVPTEVRSDVEDRRMEIGLMVGEPTGISYKFFITPRNAVDAALAIGYVPDPVLQINTSYLRHDFEFTNVGNGRLPIVYGLGLAIQFRDNPTLGIRIPVGLTYIFGNLPLSLFLDVAPRIDVTPETGLSMNASLGVRYRFFGG